MQRPWGSTEKLGLEQQRKGRKQPEKKNREGGLDSALENRLALGFTPFHLISKQVSRDPT